MVSWRQSKWKVRVEELPQSGSLERQQPPSPQHSPPSPTSREEAEISAGFQLTYPSLDLPPASLVPQVRRYSPNRIKFLGWLGAEEVGQEAGGGRGQGAGKGWTAAASWCRGPADWLGPSIHFSEQLGWAHFIDEKTEWGGTCSRSHHKYTQTQA